MDEVILGPGQRFSALVVGSQSGRHAFKSVEFKFDERQPALPEVNLGTVISHGAATDVAVAQAKVSAQRANQPLYLRDTFSVPPARNGKLGEARLIIPFTNPEIVGRFVFHCHVVKHEDKGMMMTVEMLP